MERADRLATRLRAAGCVFAEDEAAELISVADDDPELLESMTARRIAGEPLEYVVGRVRFDGLILQIATGVFIPRRRSEWLVEIADRSLPDHARMAVDIGCGTGALGLALAVRRPGLVLHAADVDPAAVRCARHNLDRVGGVVHLGDLDQALPSGLAGRVDVLLANLPYVPTAGLALMPIDSRAHEPSSSTDGGADGLDVVRRLAIGSQRLLAPGGFLIVETGGPDTGQPDRAADLFALAGLSPQIHVCEERDATAVAAHRVG